MLRPRLPDTPTYLITTAQPPTQTAPACACHHHPGQAPVYVPAPAPRRPVAPYVACGVAAVAGVVAVVTVLTALLLAVAVAGVSVAVCAVVLRSLLNQQRTR